MLFIVALFLCAGPASAALVVDQQGFGPTTGVGGGFTGVARQSFRPTADNLAGVDQFFYSVARFVDSGIDYTTNVSLRVFEASSQEDFGYAANDPLVEAALLLDTDGTREGTAAFRFAPVAITPEDWYVLEFTFNSGAAATSASNPYARGQAVEFGSQRDYFDLDFVTYSDDAFVVPLPPAAALFLPAVLMLRRCRAGAAAPISG